MALMTGFVLPMLTLTESLTLPLLVSVAVTVHVSVSPGEAFEVVTVRLEPEPIAVVPLVHA